MNDFAVCVVDDDPDVLHLMKRILEEPGYRIHDFTSASDCLAQIEREPCHLVVTDLRMPEMDGVELLTQVKARNPEIGVIIVTAYGSVETAVDAVKKGADDYLKKPFERRELLMRVERALERHRMAVEVRDLRRKIEKDKAGHELIGCSQPIRDVLRKIGIIAENDVSVVITGESGTGKELVARAIHTSSRRRKAPFLAINCGALPENLLENELFGHVKGAYTGADQDQKGVFEEADEGTLLLDEIAEAHPGIQVKLLRALQEGEIRRVGTPLAQRVDVRIIAATNKDLLAEVRAGRFREDLFYRMNVVPIHIPPLRERREDIPLLVDHFLKEYNVELNREVEGVTSAAMLKLVGYHWPGNVRELQNKLKQAILVSQSNLIAEEDIILTLSLADNQIKPFKEAKREFERSYLINVLKLNRGNITRSALQAKKGRKDFYEALRKHSLNPQDFRPARRTSR